MEPYFSTMKTFFQHLCLTALLGTSACNQPGKTVSPDTNAIQAGVVKGIVYGSQGKPLAGAKIVANSANYYNSNPTTVSDASGMYKIDLPTGSAAGSFYVRGSVRVKYNGETYDLPLFTDDDDTFSPYDGAVKNLRLKLTGDRTGNYGDEGYHGGTLEVENNTRNVQRKNIEITLTPSGPLIDGSAGQTVKRLTPADDHYIHDVAVGKYTLTARDVATGQTLGVRIRDDGNAYGRSTTGTFAPPYSGSQRFRLAVQVREL